MSATPTHHEENPAWRAVPPDEWKKFKDRLALPKDHGDIEVYEYSAPPDWNNFRDQPQAEYEKKMKKVGEEGRLYEEHFRGGEPGRGPFGYYTVPGRPDKLYFWRKLPSEQPMSRLPQGLEASAIPVQDSGEEERYQMMRPEGMRIGSSEQGFSPSKEEVMRQFAKGKFTGTQQQIPGKDSTGNFQDFRSPKSPEEQRAIEQMTGKSYLDMFLNWMKVMEQEYGKPMDSAGINSNLLGWEGQRLYYPNPLLPPMM